VEARPQVSPRRSRRPHTHAAREKSRRLSASSGSLSRSRTPKTPSQNVPWPQWPTLTVTGNDALSMRDESVGALSIHTRSGHSSRRQTRSDRHVVARRPKRRTHLCQRPSITANARRESSYAPSRGCSGGSCNRQYRSCRCKGCGAGSNLAQSTKRDVGSAIGDNGGSAPRHQQTRLVRTLVRWSRAWISSERIRARAPVS
jgi:hypothetical protein